MDKTVELTNLAIPAECCTLDIEKEKLTFYRGNKKKPGFTGLYFHDAVTFLGIYPSKAGPIIYYRGREYIIHSALDISLQKNGDNRKFRIIDYNIEIEYIKSPYIDFDEWSDEIDVDLLYMIEQKYRTQSFYDRFTVKFDR